MNTRGGWELTGPRGTVVVCWVRALRGPGPPWGAPALAGLVPAWEGSWVRCGWKSPRLGAHPWGDRSWVDGGGRRQDGCSRLQ